MGWFSKPKNKDATEALVSVIRAELFNTSPYGEIFRRPVSKELKGEVKSLIAQGADVNAKDSYGNTPLEMAVGNKLKDIVELLISNGADVNAKHIFEKTCLMEAVRGNCKDIVQILISNGADVNARDHTGITVLMFAVSYRHFVDSEDAIQEDIIKLLISKGADVNAKTDEGTTALSLANYKGYSDIVKLLKKHGAK